MKGLKQGVVAVALLISVCQIYAYPVNAIDHDHAGPNKGGIINGLSLHISDTKLICQSGAVIPGQPLHPGEMLNVRDNFDRIKAVQFTVNGKVFTLSTCFNDEMSNQMSLEHNRHFNRFIIKEGQGRGKAYYLQCADSE